MAEAATAAKTSPPEVVETDPWTHLLDLPCAVTVDLPLPRFTVGTLAQLGKGMVIDSQWSVTKDVPLRVNGELIAWSEFEVVGNRLGVRVMELA